MAEPREDNYMNRFDRAGLRRFRAREGVIAIAVAAIILILTAGPSIRKAGEEMNPGIGRDIVLGVGRPSNWVARKLPFVGISTAATSWLNPEPNLSGPGGFANPKTLAASGASLPSRPPPLNRPRWAKQRRLAYRCTRFW